MEVSLRQLRYFAAVAEHDTLREAAEYLFISQSALSTAITDLERSLGVQLCVRQKSRGVMLTPTGQFFAERAYRILRETEELVLSTSEAGETPTGPVVIGSYLSLTASVIPDLIVLLAEHLPGIQLDFVSESHDDLQELLRSGRIDIALLYDFDLDPALEMVPLMKMHPHLVLPRDHPYAGHEAVSLKALESEPLILVSKTPSRAHLNGMFRDAGTNPRVRYQVDDGATARALVARGLGYSVLMQQQPQSEGGALERIVQLPITPAPEPLSLALAWTSHASPTERARAVVEVIRGNVKRLLVEQFAAAERVDLGSYDRWESDDPGPGGIRPTLPAR